MRFNRWVLKAAMKDIERLCSNHPQSAAAIRILVDWIIEQLAEDAHLKGETQPFPDGKKNLQEMGSRTDRGDLQRVAAARPYRSDRGFRAEQLVMRAQLAQRFLRRNAIVSLSASLKLGEKIRRAFDKYVVFQRDWRRARTTRSACRLHPQWGSAGAGSAEPIRATVPAAVISFLAEIAWQECQLR